MSLLFDPTYPLHVQYVVSQSVWDLFEIHFWQILCNKWGKNRAFLTLQYRYEKKRNEVRAVLLLAVVFLLAYLIQRYMNWRRRPTQQPIGEAVEEHNGVRQRPDNQQPNGNRESAGSDHQSTQNREKRVDSNQKTQN
ncbi:unnamed protein product [Medioppia subpectinata]|uniref:Uncharacterized protein n=1 Tax=Medioppia subpectinata TaxID=1979941 RepID=A0A7R9KIA0_9ACAR|nr:unnamed protein product [Medioppia subpectinata]CAG2102680.1 unnamed protein product [Medioppia subpectinata]